MSKNSKGPWVYGLYQYVDESNKYEIVEKPFDYVGPGYYGNPSIYDANGDEVVGCDEYHVFSTPANKRLLCAAPDLLEACEAHIAALRSQIRDGKYQPEYAEVIYQAQKKMEAAIAKARGES